MKTLRLNSVQALILVLCFIIQGFAQDNIVVGRGSALFNWTADSVYAIYIPNILYITGYTHLLRTPSGNQTYTPYIRSWINFDGVKDSTISRNRNIDVTLLGTDTLHYDLSTLQANGRWTNSPDDFFALNQLSIWYQVSSEGDTLISNQDYYLITAE